MEETKTKKEKGKFIDFVADNPNTFLIGSGIVTGLGTVGTILALIRRANMKDPNEK